MRGGFRSAPVTCSLLLLNVVVFAATVLYGGGFWHTSTSVQLAWGANFAPATQDGQWWRLLSAMFLHFGIIHVALNAWALWDLGRLVEHLYGRFRFLVIYFGSGIAGNLLSLAVQGNDAVSGGASGAIFSLLGAFLVFLWRERFHVDRAEFRWFFGASTAFALLTLGMGQVIAGIDNSAHLGGLIAGALLGTIFAKPWAKGSVGDQSPRWIAAFLLSLGVVGLIILMPQPRYLFGEELRARNAVRQFLHDDQRITHNWESILAAGRQQDLSFEQLAGSIESNITSGYLESFEALRAAQPGSAAPSAKTLDELQTYAIFRAGVAQDLADGLRTNDTQKIRKALDQANKASGIQNGKLTPPGP